MMRRLVSIAVLLTLVAACKRSGEFPPSEVLRRATVQSVQLTSARFSADVRVRSTRGVLQGEATALLTGNLADGGKQSATGVKADGTILMGGTKSTFHVIAEVITELRKDAYFRVKELTMDPQPEWVTSLTELLGTWWKFSDAGENNPLQPVTPDPKFLRKQAEAVIVTTDHGLVTIHDRDAYRYDVTVDAEKLIEFLRSAAAERREPFDEEAVRSDVLKYDAEGELWIDAETFVLHRLAWVVTLKDDPEAMRLSIDVELRDHGAKVPVVPPAEFQEFRPEQFLKPTPVPAS